jgi:hypothetical protein
MHKMLAQVASQTYHTSGTQKLGILKRVTRQTSAQNVSASFNDCVTHLPHTWHPKPWDVTVIAFVQMHLGNEHSLEKHPCTVLLKKRIK